MSTRCKALKFLLEATPTNYDTTFWGEGGKHKETAAG